MFLFQPALLRGLSWRRVGYTFLVACAFALWSSSANWILLRFGLRHAPVAFVDFNFFMARFGSSFLLVLFLQMLAMTIADNVRVTGAVRFLVLTFALLLATLIAVVLVNALFYPETFDLPIRRILGENAMTTTGDFAKGALLAAVYFKRRHDNQIAAQLQAAELARVELQRKTLESDLQTMQAQVEPQFLFNTLERVETLYESNFASADRMLDSLILYLRAALPHMRSSRSTLGQEIDLVRAYLDIERAGAPSSLSLAFDVPEELATAEFPPMLLLPLVQALVAREPRAADDAIALDVTARRFESVLKLALKRNGGPALATSGLEDLRRRLSALYGAAGKLVAERSGAAGVSVDLRIPLAGLVRVAT